MPLKSGVLIADRYLIQEGVGSGWNSVYFRATQQDIERDVTLKVLRKKYAARADLMTAFQNEMRLTARLEHQNIVPLYDAGTYGGRPFLVMRFLKQGSIRRLLATQRQIAIGEKLRLLREVADALDYIHSEDVIHGALRPDNLVLDGRERVYVTDFQQYRAIEHIDTSRQGLSAYLFMPPEQLEGGALTPQTDIYSLAATAYLFLSGVPAFAAATIDDHRRLRYAPLPKLSANAPDLPAAADDVFVRALQPLPSDRPASASEFWRALDKTIAAGAAPKRKIFLSYSREDSETARQLVADLSANQMQVWFDQTSIQPGELWEPAIRRGISEADKVVALLSPPAIESPYVQAEIDYAVEKGKSIIPVMYRACDVPLQVRLLQYIDFDRLGYGRGFELLLRALLA